MRCERHCLRVKLEVHARIVEKGSLVDIDVKAAVSTHLERCLHTVHRVWSLRVISADGILHLSCNLRETALCEIVLLGIVITRYPPSCMITCECKLSHLLLDHEVAELALIWELVTESETIVIEAETDSHLSVCRSLDEVYEKLVVMVADLCLLTPHWFPCLVKCRSLYAFEGESVIERVARLTVFLRNGAICVVNNLLRLEHSTEFKSEV